jgi:predicted nucleic acid-binding protein
VRSFLIDASVAIKWVIDEDGTREALALRSHLLAAADLLTAECANILWKKVRRGEISADEAGFAAKLLGRADIDLLPMRSFFEPATRIAVALDHPAYDCVYLAAAEAVGLPFVTADERLLRKLRQESSGRFASRALNLAEAADAL